MTAEEKCRQTDEDYEYLKQYHLSDVTMSSISVFFDHKKAFFVNPESIKGKLIKMYFQEAHADLKVECSNGRISPALLAELTEFLKRGV